jgi:hypothetical protein
LGAFGVPLPPVSAGIGSFETLLGVLYKVSGHVYLILMRVRSLFVGLPRQFVGRHIMKLILLYGPLAAGKLTIAKEIARLTGFKVFHSHLSVNLVEAIFSRGTHAYRRLRL